MGKNPLIGIDGGKGRGGSGGGDGPSLYDPNDLLGSANRLNSLNFSRQDPRWHYVKPAKDGEPEKLAVVTGIDAQEVWTVFDGKRLDYKGWSAGRLEAVERQCRWLIERGMVRRTA
jgi:hypothetical protein